MAGQRKRKDIVRVALIGTGDMARNVHYPNLASFEDVQLVALCDTDLDRLAVTADQFNIEQRYTDYRLMIEECAPDGIYAIGQPQIMYESWIWCLEHQQNLYIEKPMGITWHQARMLAYVAQLNSLVTQVSHQRRTAPLLVEMRRICLERGPIIHAVCEFYKFSPMPYMRSYDHMLDDCTHAIDTLRSICGGEVVKIESYCRSVGTPDVNWIGAMLQFDSGATGFLINCWTSGRRIFRIEMHGVGINVDLDIEEKAILYADGDPVGIEYDAKETAGSSEYRVFGGFRAKSREFIDSIKHGVEVTSSPFRDGLKTMEVAEKILAQALLRQ